jgi:hypothetical protein
MIALKLTLPTEPRRLGSNQSPLSARPMPMTMSAGEGFKLGMPSADLLLVVLSIVIKVPFVQVLVVAVVVRLSYKLGGKSNLPPLAAEAKLVIDPPPATADAATVASGEALFDRFCSVCHGEAAVAGGVVPDLRGSPFIAVAAIWTRSKLGLQVSFRGEGLTRHWPLVWGSAVRRLRSSVSRR